MTCDFFQNCTILAVSYFVRTTKKLSCVRFEISVYNEHTFMLLLFYCMKQCFPWQFWLKNFG